MSKENNLVFICVIYYPENIEYFFESFNNNFSGSLIIINNGPVESISKKIKSISNIEIIQNNENIGFGKAMNIGLSIAIKRKFEYSCIFNQDVKLNCLQIQQYVSNLSDDHVIISPLHKYSNGNLEFYFEKCLLQANCKNYEDKFDIQFVNAACWLIKMDKIIQIGGFNPLFFMYGEDLNICHRIRFAGLRIAIDPSISVIHDKLIADYEVNIDKKLSVHASYVLALILNPNNPQSFWRTSSNLIKTIGFRFLKLEWKTSLINCYALFYIFYKGRQIGKSKKLQLEKGAFLNE